MSNMVTLSGPNPTQEIISHFLDQYNANQRSRAEVGVQQQQLDQSASQHNDNFGLLQKQYEQKLAEYNDKQLNDDAVPVKARLASFSDAAQSTQDPNERAAIEAQAKAFFDGLDPRMQAKVKLDALAPVLTPQRQAQLNTNKFSATQTGIAAGGGTDPNAVNFTTKMATNSFMPTEGFTQQQATDLASRDKAPDSAGTPTPNLSAKIPAPSGNAVSDYEARQTGAMPKASENQTAQTQLTQTGMQIAADAPYKAAMTREASAKAAISEGQAKMASGDPSAVNSFAIGVFLNPRSYKSLTTDEKRMAVQGLGGRAPAELGQPEETAFDAAQNTMDGVKRSLGIIKKWQDQGVKITGPMLGRYNEATNAWGDSILPSNLPPEKAQELQGDIAALQQNLGISKLNELHSVIGGRVPVQMAQIIAAPNMAQNPAMLAGALAGMYQIANGRVEQLNSKVWNGHPPQFSGATLDRYKQIAGAQTGAAGGSAQFDYVPGKGLVPAGATNP